MLIWAIDELQPSAPKWPLWPAVPVCVLRACDSATDGTVTSADCKWMARTFFKWGGPPVDPPILVCGLKIWWLLGWNVKEDQASSAFWLCSLGFKVGQLMPGSSRAKWTSLAVVFGGVLEEPPGRWGCQGNMKHLQCRQKKKRNSLGLVLSYNPSLRCRALKHVSFKNLKTINSAEIVDQLHVHSNTYWSLYLQQHETFSSCAADMKTEIGQKLLLSGGRAELACGWWKL